MLLARASRTSLRRSRFSRAIASHLLAVIAQAIGACCDPIVNVQSRPSWRQNTDHWRAITSWDGALTVAMTCTPSSPIQSCLSNNGGPVSPKVGPPRVFYEVGATFVPGSGAQMAYWHIDVGVMTLDHDAIARLG